MAEKKIIFDVVHDMSAYEFEGTLTDLKNRLQYLTDKFGPDLMIRWDPYFHYKYDPEPSPRFEVIVKREETDQEFNERMAHESIREKETEERERREFDRLKKKFDVINNSKDNQ